MKTTIDLLTSITGWTGPAGAEFIANDHAEYCADYLATSLIIHFPANSSGGSFKKILAPSVDLSLCSDIVLMVWPRYPLSARKSTEYSFKISFDGVHWYLLPIESGFSSVAIGIHGFTTADRIEIVPLDNTENWLIISGCYGIQEDLPLDLMTGVKAGIERKVTEVAPVGVLLPGTITGALAAETATITLDRYVSQGAALVFGLGTAREERHQVEQFDDTGAMTFTAAYDGRKLLYAHAADPVNLLLPVAFGAREKEAYFPGITVWVEDTEDAQDFSDIAEVMDSMDLTGGAGVRRAPWFQGFHVLIDCEARSAWVLHLMARAVRRFIASSRVWVNGQPIEIIAPPTANYLEPDESAVMIPKLQYDITINLREERAPRVWQPAAGPATITVIPTIGQL